MFGFKEWLLDEVRKIAKVLSSSISHLVTAYTNRLSVQLVTMETTATFVLSMNTSVIQHFSQDTCNSSV